MVKSCSSSSRFTGVVTFKRNDRFPAASSTMQAYGEKSILGPQVCRATF